METSMLLLTVALAVFFVGGVLGYVMYQLSRFRSALPPSLDSWLSMEKRLYLMEQLQQDLQARFTRFQNREALNKARQAKVDDQDATEAAVEAASRILGRDPNTVDWVDQGAGPDPYAAEAGTESIPGMSPQRVAALRAKRQATTRR